jgi:nucleoside-diphosphate-sugar epimerase
MIRGIKRGYYFNIGGGRAQKSMVLAEDVANQIIKISEIGGVYNLSDGYHPNFNELSRLIASQLGVRRIPNISYFLAKVFAIVGDVLGKKIPFDSDKLKKITANLTFDDSKARATFGWNPTPVLKGFKIKL